MRFTFASAERLESTPGIARQIGHGRAAAEDCPEAIERLPVRAFEGTRSDGENLRAYFRRTE